MAVHESNGYVVRNLSRGSDITTHVRVQELWRILSMCGEHEGSTLSNKQTLGQMTRHSNNQTSRVSPEVGAPRDLGPIESEIMRCLSPDKYQKTGVFLPTAPARRDQPVAHQDQYSPLH